MFCFGFFFQILPCPANLYSQVLNLLKFTQKHNVKFNILKNYKMSVYFQHSLLSFIPYLGSVTARISHSLPIIKCFQRKTLKRYKEFQHAQLHQIKATGERWVRRKGGEVKQHGYWKPALLKEK